MVLSECFYAAKFYKNNIFDEFEQIDKQWTDLVKFTQNETSLVLLPKNSDTLSFLTDWIEYFSETKWNVRCTIAIMYAYFRTQNSNDLVYVPFLSAIDKIPDYNKLVIFEEMSQQF